MKIFILAGGFGTRLKSVVSDVPKPMAPIIDKPFLEYQIELIRKYFKDAEIYLLTYYLSDIIKDYFTDDKLVTIIKEEEPLGTGGSIKHAIEYLDLDMNDSILVFNGDTFIEPELTQMITNKSHDILILGSLQEDCDRYGTLELNGESIVRFLEKKDGVRNSYINAGCYYFNTLSFFENIEDRSFSVEEEFTKYLRLNNSIGIFKYNGVFIDIGIPKDYKKMISYINGIKLNE